MTVLSDPVKNLAKIADFDGSGYLEVWTSIRDGGADGILTDAPVHTPITSTGITTPDLVPGPAYYRLKLGKLRPSIEGRIVIPATDARVMDVIAASILIPEDTPAQLVVQAVQSYLTANPPSGGGLTEEEADTRYAPLFQPNTAYVAGAPVVAPSGDVVTAKTNFTSGASFVSADWNVPAVLTTATGRAIAFAVALG